MKHQEAYLKGYMNKDAAGLGPILRGAGTSVKNIMPKILGAGKKIAPKLTPTEIANVSKAGVSKALKAGKTVGDVIGPGGVAGAGALGGSLGTIGLQNALKKPTTAPLNNVWGKAQDWISKNPGTAIGGGIGLIGLLALLMSMGRR